MSLRKDQKAKMDARERGANVTEEQKTLLQFMEKHPCLMSSKTADFTYKDATILWQKLTNILNICNGVSKDWKSWRKVYIGVHTEKSNNFITQVTNIQIITIRLR